VISTPFDSRGECDLASFSVLLDYVAQAGANGALYPAIASEFATLSLPERKKLVSLALARMQELGLPLVVGVSAETVADSTMLAEQASKEGAAAILVMAPRWAGNDVAQITDFVSKVTHSAQDLPVMLQNAPPPPGSSLPVDTVIEVVRALPRIRYVKEENVPCGQRITEMLEKGGDLLWGVMGGAGGRFVLDEYARGACGSMPACEMVEAHVAIWNAVRAGQAGTARGLVTRILPLLNHAAVFRQHTVKHVLKHRGLIECDFVRDETVPLDDYDRAEIDASIADIEDLMTVRHGNARVGAG